MLDNELSEHCPQHTHVPIHRRTKKPKMAGKESDQLCGRESKMAPAFLSQEREKKFTELLGQNRWEPVEPLVLVSYSQQIKLVLFRVFFSLIGSAFPKVSGWSEQLLHSYLISSW